MAALEKYDLAKQDSCKIVDALVKGMRAGTDAITISAAPAIQCERQL